MNEYMNIYIYIYVHIYIYEYGISLSADLCVTNLLGQTSRVSSLHQNKENFI